MKKYLLILAAASLACSAAAHTPRNPRKTRAARLEAAERAADSLRAVTALQAALIDSLQCLSACPEEEEEIAGESSQARYTSRRKHPR